MAKYNARSRAVQALDISDEDRIVSSVAPLVLLKSFIPQPVHYAKPNGLWYACGRSWMEWTYAEKWRSRFNYVYRLHVDVQRLLHVTTLAEFDAFQQVYVTGNVRYDAVPEWLIVAEDYTGVEICPYQWDRRYVVWYYIWDVASGCIWDTSIIQDVEQLLEP